MTVCRVNSTAIAIVALVTAACSSSKDSAPRDGGFNFGDALTSTDTGHSTDAKTTAHDAGHVVHKDAGTTPVDAGIHVVDSGEPGCGSLAVSGAIIGPTSQPGQPPGAAGGSIPPGTYVLVEADYYPAAGAPDAGPGIFVQRTLAFTADTLTVAETRADSLQGPAGATVITGNSYQIAGTNLGYTESCPLVAHVATNDPYSVVAGDAGDAGGTELWLFPNETGYFREVYALQ
jgi:hypothetical protein